LSLDPERGEVRPASMEMRNDATGLKVPKSVTSPNGSLFTLVNNVSMAPDLHKRLLSFL